MHGKEKARKRQRRKRQRLRFHRHGQKGWGLPLQCSAPAGSGNTTAVHEAIPEVVNNGARVLLTAPTGRLAATMREKFPELEVDTVHGAFLVYKPVLETLELMWPYDLVIVEEVGQLSKANFERIMEQWIAAERLPTLVFVGDFFQLPGVDSWMWHNIMIKKRELHTMRRCKCDKLRKTLEILRAGEKPQSPKPGESRLHHESSPLCVGCGKHPGGDAWNTFSHDQPSGVWSSERLCLGSLVC